MRRLETDGVQAALDRRLNRKSTAPLAIGFSGGSDSLALLLLAKTWADRAGRPVVALTVDHQLSADSGAWTRRAGEVAARIGVDWLGLPWEGPKPTAGLPQAARLARHRLLATAARTAGACVLLLGHTADDAAESEVMRQDTPGLGRLRDWSPSPVWPEGRDIFLLRPLLAYRRAALRAWLTGHGWTWLEDPGNADPRFARSRARRALAVQPRPDSGSPSLETDGADAQHLAEAFAISADARISFDPRLIRNAASKASHRALSAALVCAGGGERPPRGEALDRLMALIHASGPHGVTSTATLAGTRVRWRYDGVEMGREAGRASISPLSLAAGEGGVFDGRYFVEAEAAVTMVALAGRMAGLSRSDRARTLSAPAYARGVLPALLDLNGDVRLPRPFGDGPARVQPLVGRRFAAALGLIATEAQLEQGLDMAPDHVSSYVLSQKLVF